MKDQLNNQKNNISSRVELGVEFGDINASKVIETLEMKKDKKERKNKRKN